ncbi:MAG: ImuA family protein [Rhodospirillaceae bacterium]
MSSKTVSSDTHGQGEAGLPSGLPAGPVRKTLPEALKARIKRLERGRDGREAPDDAIGSQGPGTAQILRFDVPELDRALPGGGLAMGRLHAVEGAGTDFEGPATAFAALLAARALALRPGGTVLWCLRRGQDDSLFPPGLASLGLAPEDLLILRVSSETDMLWAMEEALRCPAIAAVVGQVRKPGATPARRLQLAAETGGGLGLFLLRRPQRPAPAAKNASPFAASAFERHQPPGRDQPGVGVCVTRWDVASSPAAPAPWSAAPGRQGGLGAPRWRLALRRCRGGLPFETTMEWNDETGHVRVVPDLPHRPALSSGHAIRRVA